MPTVKYTDLLPSTFKQRMKQHPIAYLPLGTLEWHGEHLPLGADSIQSEALMIEAAKRFGGIVMPPLFLGPDRRQDNEDGTYLIGMDYAKSTSPHQQLPGSCYWVSYDFFKQLLAVTLEQLKRAGFTTVFADGHGPSRRAWNEMIPQFEKQFGLRLIGIGDELKERWGYMNDHAALNETSITKYVRPDLVDLSVFKQGSDSPLVGVNGEHPYNATEENGKLAFENALLLLEELIKPKT